LRRPLIEVGASLVLLLGFLAPATASHQQLTQKSLSRASPVETARPAEPESKGDKKKIDAYAVKAAFLYNFFRYTDWPDPKDKKAPEPFELWVVGDDPFGELLDKTFKGKKIDGRTVTITRHKDVPKSLDAHMVFAGTLTDKQRAKLIELAKGKSLLLIGDVAGFAELGAHANLLLNDGNISVEVNTGEVKSSSLSISSDLLKVSTVVKTKKFKKKSGGNKPR
jgi:hypothetical protein